MARKKDRFTKQDALTYQELNMYSDISQDYPTDKNTLPRPEDDSPGDSADNEVTETLIGMEYEEEGPEDLRGVKLPYYSETKLKHADTGEDVVKLGENVRVISSERPDPAKDLDKPTSTH